jgi:ABC-type uncharacterized transport system ATPase subunit
MVHQHFTLVPAMTVAENVALGLPGWGFRARSVRALVRELGEHTGLSLDPDARVIELSVGAQQRLEVLKAFARDTRILILDEPTAVLAPAEAAELMSVVRRFADSGRLVVLITHKLREALGVADMVTVLRRGRVVLVARGTEVSERELSAAMVGEEASDERARRSGVAGDVVLRTHEVEVRDARGTPRVRNVSLEVHRGEILGVAGVEGAGHRELLRAVAGRAPIAAGRIDRPTTIGFVPEDRQQEALVLDFSLSENVALRGAGHARGRMPWRALRARTELLLRAFDVRGGSASSPAAVLSGGNQQKLVLARELDGDPDLVVAENPTRGLDVAATAAVHRRLREARARGAGVVVYSSDIDEMLLLADRVVVMFAGHAREVALDRTMIGEALLGL